MVSKADRASALGPPKQGEYDYEMWFRSLEPSIRQKEKYRRWALHAADQGSEVPLFLISYQDTKPEKHFFRFDWQCLCLLWPDWGYRGGQEKKVSKPDISGSTLVCKFCEREWYIDRWEWASLPSIVTGKMPREHKATDPRTAICRKVGSVSRLSFLMLE